MVFLPGYASDMTGSKALHLESVCTASGHGFLRLDYSGHGASSGRFVDGTIGQWTDDAVLVIAEVTRGPLILVGSSMGGWIMLLAALALRERVAGLVGIAAAPDFTEDLMWDGFDAEQRAALERDAVLTLPSDTVDDPYPVTLELIEEGRQHLLLRSAIELDCPVRLIHGLADTDVPWQTSARLAERLVSDDVTLTLIKGGGHRLSEPRELDLIAGVLSTLIDPRGTGPRIVQSI